jgi:hypothetical protein
MRRLALDGGNLRLSIQQEKRFPPHPPTTNISQSYDPNGNRTQSALPSGVASATGAGNRMLYDGSCYYTYDADGNRTAKYQNSVDSGFDSHATNITIYNWNNANELVSVKTYATYSDYTSGATPSSEVDYAYDAFGRMVSMSPSGGTAENFIYDGQNVALVLNSVGQAVERELYGPAVDQVLATEYATPLSDGGPQSAGTVDWALPDNQQTIRDVAVYNSSTHTTSIADHLVYDPFGQMTYQSNSANQPQFTYEGMWQDPVTGLDLSSPSAWYDPSTGGSLSQLSTNPGQGTNPYEFSNNSPTNPNNPSPTGGSSGLTTISNPPDGPNPTNYPSVYSSDAGGYQSSSNSLTGGYGAGDYQAGYGASPGATTFQESTSQSISKNAWEVEWEIEHQWWVAHRAAQQAVGTLTPWWAVSGGGAVPVSNLIRDDGDWFDTISDFFAAFGDTVTLNGTKRIRQAAGIDQVNYQSAGYANGAAAGTVANVALSTVSPCGPAGALIKAVNAVQAISGSLNAADNIAQGQYVAAASDIAGVVGNAAQLGTSCFVAGTPLLTQDGSKPIEEFKVGDLVLSAPEDDPSAPVQPRRVEEIFTRVSPLIEVRVRGQVIRTTVEHPFYVHGKGWLQASALSEGDLLKSHDGQFVGVDDIAVTDEVTTVYNMRIAEYHTYFVGDVDWGFSVWAHNSEYEAPRTPNGPVESRHYSSSPEGVSLHDEAQAFRDAQGLSPQRNVATANVVVDGNPETVRFVNDPGGMHSEQKLIAWDDAMQARGADVKVLQVYSERPPCGDYSANCANTLGNRYGQNLDVYHGNR